MVMRPYIMKLILKLHINMVMRAYCKLEKLEKAVEAFREMKSMGFRPNTASYNTLIAGHCSKVLLSFAVKFKNSMERSGVHQDVVTFNTLIHGFCK
jgi:pentatricopeptide repeat protein